MPCAVSFAQKTSAKIEVRLNPVHSPAADLIFDKAETGESSRTFARTLRNPLDTMDRKPNHSTPPKPSQKECKEKSKRAVTLVKINRRETAYQPPGTINDPIQR